MCQHKKYKQLEMEEKISKELLFSLNKPHVFKSNKDVWTSKLWSPEQLPQDVKIKFRIGCKPALSEQTSPQWEGDCNYENTTIQQFTEWLNNKCGDGNPLNKYKTDKHFCYGDYKYMSELFSDHPSLLKDINWSSLGFPGRDGKESTFWMGSEGSHTPCHYDTYGCNLVAQIYGKKFWILFPPEQTSLLYATRIPYEESSVFSEVNILNPDLCKHRKFKQTTPHVIMLEEGDVLFVPKHWWHFVYSTETSISVNTWLELDDDCDRRLEEAVTRTIVSYFVTNNEPDDWINPTEKLLDPCTNIEYINSALLETQQRKIENSEIKHQDTESNELVSNVHEVKAISFDKFLENIQNIFISQQNDDLPKKKLKLDEHETKNIKITKETLIKYTTHPKVIQLICDLMKDSENI